MSKPSENRWSKTAKHFTAALLLTAKIRGQPRGPSTDECRNMVHCTREFHSAIEENEILMFSGNG